MTEQRIVTNDGVGLQVEINGDGPPIVFVAGYCASLATWVLQAEAVVAAGFQSVAIDRRWHGRSDQPVHGHRIARHAADVRAVVEALGIERPLLVGASMGAGVCWSYIDIYGTDAVAGMIAVDQTPRLVNADGWTYGYYGLDEDNLGRFFANGVPETGRGASMERSQRGFERMMEKAGDVALGTPPTPETRGLLDDHARADWRDLCAGGTVPLLLIAGRDSQLWPCEHAAAAVADNPLGEFLVLDDCGHAIQADQPERLNDAIISFARRTLVQVA